MMFLFVLWCRVFRRHILLFAIFISFNRLFHVYVFSIDSVRSCRGFSLLSCTAPKRTIAYFVWTGCDELTTIFSQWILSPILNFPFERTLPASKENAWFNFRQNINKTITIMIITNAAVIEAHLVSAQIKRMWPLARKKKHSEKVIKEVLNWPRPWKSPSGLLRCHTNATRLHFNRYRWTSL